MREGEEAGQTRVQWGTREGAQPSQLSRISAERGLGATCMSGATENSRGRSLGTGTACVVEGREELVTQTQ